MKTLQERVNYLYFKESEREFKLYNQNPYSIKNI